MKVGLPALLFLIAVGLAGAAAPTLTINGDGELEISDGTVGDFVTCDDTWNWPDGVSNGDGDVPIDGGGTEKVSAYMTEIVKDGVYLILDDITFGDGSAASYFQSHSGEMVYFVDGVFFTVTANATLELGEQEDVLGIASASWSVEDGTHTFMDDGTFLMSSSLLYLRNAGAGHNCIFENGIIDWRLSIVTGSGESTDLQFSDSLSSLSIIRTSFIDLLWITLKATPDVFDNVVIFATDYGLLSGGSPLVTSPAIINSTSADVSIVFSNEHPVIRNPAATITSVVIWDNSSDIAEQYTCNIHTIDVAGADLASVDVDCDYTHLVEGSDSKTYKCILNHTAVDATHLPITGNDWASFWVLYDAGGGLGGDWNTGFDYKVDQEEFATETTDANGDISEQTIQYKKWVGTSEILEMRHHDFTFTETGYKPLIMLDVIVDHPLVWEIEMLVGGRSPGIGSGIGR